jgi:HTH-type transcriptional regulator / antitoxin HigA
MNEMPNSPAIAIKKMLEERNWTQMDLAFLLGWTSGEVSLLLSEKKNFTIKIARDLAIIFGTTPDFWLDIHRKYELSKLGATDNALAKRSQIYNRFPVKEMLKRGWVMATDDIDKLESQVLEFFNIKSLDDKLNLNYAALKSNSYFQTTDIQAAWITRAYRLAKGSMVKKFSQSALVEAFEKLKLLLFDVEEIRHIPKILNDAGVRFLIIEPLPSSKIDGVTFWLDDNSPVIVLSLRFDRIDSFWFALMHELSHVKNNEGKDAPIIDNDLLNEDSLDFEKPDFEKRADKDAAEFSIPNNKLDSFLMRVHPTYSEMKILGFSALNKIHAGIVVGQLHHRYKISGKGLPFTHLRKHLVKVRQIITETALTDGYGYQPFI